MPKFSAKSLERLSECDVRLQRIMHEVIKHRDCTITTGHRSQEAQDEAVRTGTSKTPWPKSKHNSMPSKAVDVVPYPVDWKDRERFANFAGFVQGIAESMGIKIRWGGDWDQDGLTKDERFSDMPHFELME